MLLFEGTGLIKLNTSSYADVVLRMAEEHELDEFRDRAWRFELWLALESPAGTGYVSCGCVSAREVTSMDRRVPVDGRLIMAMNYSTHLATLPAPPLQRPQGTSPATAFAVTRNGETWRLLHCDDDWNIIGSSTHEGAYKAMRQAATEFEALEF